MASWLRCDEFKSEGMHENKELVARNQATTSIFDWSQRKTEETCVQMVDL
jgi:hypothetical protein